MKREFKNLFQGSSNYRRDREIIANKLSHFVIDDKSSCCFLAACSDRIGILVL